MGAHHSLESEVRSPHSWRCLERRIAYIALLVWGHGVTGLFRKCNISSQDLQDYTDDMCFACLLLQVALSISSAKHMLMVGLLT
jgi:hypothetical protein